MEYFLKKVLVLTKENAFTIVIPFVEVANSSVAAPD